jgi:ABC-2 type transport system ATP-binding protein
MMVRTVGLAKAYGPRAALSDVDLEVEAGSVYGLVGPNGAGKTTLLSILAGLRAPTAGEVVLDAPRQKIAVLPDAPRFEPWLTGREVVSLAAGLAEVDEKEAVPQALVDAGLADRADHHTGDYSRGMLQRLGLAATMVGRPELLLLDEPASALDPAGRREVLDLIVRLRGRATVVLSSHLLADVQEVCDTIGILRAGRLLYQGPIEALLVGRAVPAYQVTLRSEIEPVAAALRDAAWVRSVEPGLPNALRVVVTSLADAEQNLAGVLAACGARVVSVVPEAPDLEDVFLELTS